MQLIKDTEIKPTGKTKTNRQHSIFLCKKCNKEVERPKKDGIKAKTCGCKISYKNQIIGNFLILDDDLQGRDRRLFLCKCLLCNNNKEILSQSIINNIIYSCGCKKNEISALKHIKHNGCKERLYSIFRGMISRCENKNSISYSNYGDKGVTICEEWRKSYQKFKEWALNNGYQDSLSIDRINPYGNYEPSNCRWATSEVQARNTRTLQKNNTTGYKGVFFNENTNNYKAVITVNYKIIRLGTFSTALEAATIREQYIIDNDLEHSLNGVCNV